MRNCVYFKENLSARYDADVEQGNDTEPEAAYERYNGSWVQDIEGWSDQDIDDVLDGTPNAYWNLD